MLLYNGDDDDVQRSPPNPAGAGLSDARRCDDGDGPENRFVIMMVIYMFMRMIDLTRTMMVVICGDSYVHNHTKK